MEYTITQVQSVLRNYEAIIARKRNGDNTRDLSSKPTVVVDDVRISREGLKMLVELQQAGTGSDIKKININNVRMDNILEKEQMGSSKTGTTPFFWRGS